MKIGVIKEIKNNEKRVGMLPSGVKELTNQGHEVFIETTAGIHVGFDDDAYIAAGGKICDTAKAWSCELVIKVKEPQPEEFQYFYEGQILFCYLHLAAEAKLTQSLLENKVTALTYETLVENGLPLLRPMSEVAGRRAVLQAANLLESHHGGKGQLICPIPGCAAAKVAIIGGGSAGLSALRVAIGLEADVTILELNEDKIRYISDLYGVKCRVLKSTEQNIYETVINSDIVISTVLIPGEKAPKVLKEYMVKEMQPKSVIVDVAIDQGGSVETITHATTHDNPTYIVHDVIHYAVANMPGATQITSTYGLCNATLTYIKMLANNDLEQLILSSNPIKTSVNVKNGQIIHPALKAIFKDIK